MNKTKYFPPLVCGFGAAVISTIPAMRGIGCCLVLPVAAWLSLFLELKINKASLPIDVKSALFFGLLTGLFTAFFSSGFDLLYTFIFHSNDFVQGLPQTESAMRNLNLGQVWNSTNTLLKQMSADITANGFSLLYAFVVIFGNIFIDSIFGILGGFIGMAIINKRTGA